MNFVTIFCHQCGSIFERSERSFLQSPYCVTCGSDFVENFSEATAVEASPEPIHIQEGILQGVRNPYFEDPFATGLTERGFPFALQTPVGDSEAMYGTMEGAPRSLEIMTRPQNGARDNQRHGRSGSLTATIDRSFLQVPASRPPRTASNPCPLKRESVCGPNGHLTRESCVICHEKYRRNESVIKLQCDHVFHEGCVMRWLHDHDTCPICRFKVPTRAIQFQAPTQTDRGSNRAPMSSSAARGRNANASSSPGPALSNAPRNAPNPSSRNRRRRTQANRIQSSSPSQVPSFIPLNVSHHEQSPQPPDHHQTRRNEVLQTRERETAVHLIQLHLLNDLLNSSSNRGATGRRNVYNRSLLS